MNQNRVAREAAKRRQSMFDQATSQKSKMAKGIWATNAIVAEETFSRSETFVMPETVKEEDSRIKSFYLNKVPILPLPLAVALCVTNCILPGIGSILAGGFVHLYKNEQDEKEVSHGHNQLIMNVLLIGISQLCTVVFFFIGWFWSIIWGVWMVQLARAKRKEQEEKEQENRQEVFQNGYGVD